MTAHADTAPLIPATWHDLDRPQQLLLWAMRTWVRGVKNGMCPEAQLTEGLLGFISPDDAVPALERFLITIAAQADGPIDVRCPSCRAISPDERALIAFVSACHDTRAHGGSTAAIKRFARLVQAAGMKACIKAAFELAIDFFPPNRAAGADGSRGVATDQSAAIFHHGPSSTVH
jgi:hypothetical protein